MDFFNFSGLLGKIMQEKKYFSKKSKKLWDYLKSFYNFYLKICGFGKVLWSPIISRSLTIYMIYDHSRSWSAKAGKIWSTITHDRDLIGNDRRSRSDTPNSGGGGKMAPPTSLKRHLLDISLVKIRIKININIHKNSVQKLYSKNWKLRQKRQT